MKKYLFIFTAVALVGWVAFRFAAIGSENERFVFNAARSAADVGAPVEVLQVTRGTDVLREPVHVENNVAYVSGTRVGKFKVGQKIGDGRIVSVGTRLDLDTGMYVIRTNGVKDGLNYVEASKTGYFVPAYAVTNNTVMVEVNGVAQKREVQVVDKDADHALISTGLADGEHVILSTINDGARVKFQS
mgnify:FL=1